MYTLKKNGFYWMGLIVALRVHYCNRKYINRKTQTYIDTKRQTKHRNKSKQADRQTGMHNTVSRK